VATGKANIFPMKRKDLSDVPKGLTAAELFMILRLLIA
jgi:hypothetical protein